MRAASTGLEYRAAGYVAAPVILRALSPVWPAAPVRRAGIGDQVILENLDRRKPAAAMASSSSWRLQEMQTVTIEVFTLAPQ
jgi:hypothetical protein